MSDEELRALHREALSSGDANIMRRYERALERAGFPAWYPWRVLQAPNIEPYEWSPNVDAWLTGSDTYTRAEDLLFEFAMGIATPTRIVVRKTSIEEGLELAAGWLADNQPGFFHQPEYPITEEGICSICQADPHQDQCQHFQQAEADLSYTESGWLQSWEWAVSTLDPTRTLISMLSRALPGDDPDEDEDDPKPFIVLGAFWDVSTIYPTRSQYFFPPYWNEEEIRETLHGEVPEGQTLFVTEPDFNDPTITLYFCWAEEGDDPVGDDAEEFCSVWKETSHYALQPSSDNPMEDMWIHGAEQLLSEVTRFKPREAP